MVFDTPLREGRLIRRYRRFLADVETADGFVTAHCPNTGSMLGCADPGNRVWLSSASNPKRKYAWTWELVEVGGLVKVGINTGRSNALVREAIEASHIAALRGYETIRAEVPYGDRRSRIDLLLSAPNRPDCYVEVKNVTAAVERGIGYFPDAVTTRGTKHLLEMVDVVRLGKRAVLCFCVQRGDTHEVRPADHIDPTYGHTLRKAMSQGVEVLAYGADVSTSGIELRRPLHLVTP
ncbi:MAG: DNA/RNA nuclease SfsA [Rhodocyclaceae bacterium]